MSISRQQLLQQRANSALAAQSPLLPPYIRDLYSKARDSADLTLALQDEAVRKEALLAQQSQQASPQQEPGAVQEEREEERAAHRQGAVE